MKTFEDLKHEIIKAKNQHLVSDLWIYPNEIIFYLPKHLQNKIPELTDYISKNFTNCRVIGYKMNDSVFAARIFVEKITNS